MNILIRICLKIVSRGWDRKRMVGSFALLIIEIHKNLAKSTLAGHHLQTHSIKNTFRRPFQKHFVNWTLNIFRFAMARYRFHSNRCANQTLTSNQTKRPLGHLIVSCSYIRDSELWLCHWCANSSPFLKHSWSKTILCCTDKYNNVAITTSIGQQKVERAIDLVITRSPQLVY